MAKNTLYGIVMLVQEPEPFGNLRSLPNDTFRLHLGHGVDPVKDLCLLKESTVRVKDSVFDVASEVDNIHLRIHIGNYASAGMFYEREFHVSRDKNYKDQDVLHLKEGPRFFETHAGDTFPHWLGLFLGTTIPRQ